MAELGVRKISDGHKNYSVLVQGTLSEGDITVPLPIVKLADLQPVPDAVKLRRATWMIQEKLGVELWWGQSDILMVLESRGMMSTEQDISSPRRSLGWAGEILLTTFGWAPPRKHLMFVLEFDKHG